MGPHKFFGEQTRHSQYVAVIPLLLGALILSSDSARAADQADSSSRNLLIGKSAMGDWTTDAPGLRRKITIADLPPPFATESANNGPHVVERPAGAQLHVPSGFTVQEYATGFRNPRFLLTAPNGDIFVTESEANEIKMLRGTNAGGKPASNVIFANDGLKQAFGIAFYPPGSNPNYLYVANTDGVVRFPYRNGDLKARGPAEKLHAELSGGGLLRGGGHWTRDMSFRPTGKKCMSRSARARTIQMMRPKQIAPAFSNSTPTAPGRKFTRGESGTPSGSLSDRELTNSG